MWRKKKRKIQSKMAHNFTTHRFRTTNLTYIEVDTELFTKKYKNFVFYFEEKQAVGEEMQVWWRISDYFLHFL